MPSIRPGPQPIVHGAMRRRAPRRHICSRASPRRVPASRVAGIMRGGWARASGWRSSSAALLLLVLALWVNLGVGFLLLMAAALTPQERRRRLFLVAIAAAAGAAAGAYLPPVHTTTAITPASGWMSGWTQLLQN